jgi:chitodextrinase
VTTSSIGVEWTAGSDSVSGVDHYILYVNGAPWGSVTATGATVSNLTPNLFYTFTVATVDTAGNVSSESPSLIEATVALTPLETTPIVTPAIPDGLNDWYVTTPTVTFSVAPAIPAWTYYSWDGAELATATGPIEPPSNGTHVLSYWSVDQAGEHAREATQQITLSQDAVEDVRLNPNALPTMEATTTLVTDTDQPRVDSCPPRSAARPTSVGRLLGSTTDVVLGKRRAEPSAFKIYRRQHCRPTTRSHRDFSRTSPPLEAPAIVFASSLGA